jgi:threonyl-tRNA synthetase
MVIDPLAFSERRYSDVRPLWLSPRQVIVIPIAHAFDHYAESVAKRFYDAGFYAEADLGSETLKKKILEAQFAQWNYILGTRAHSFSYLFSVVGQQELDQKAVNVRIRDDVSTRNQGVPVALDECLAKLLKLRDERSLKHSLD